QYHSDWITVEEESILVEHIEQLRFSEVRMHGVIAKRQVVHFGWDYEYDSWTISPTQPIPEWVLPFRARAAALMIIPDAAIQEVLVTRYRPGAGIGWHRDAPMFGPAVLGMSLAGNCRMRFQRMVGRKRQTAEVLLKPRSCYMLAGASRFVWQHSIPPAKELRYSLTFRTVKTDSRPSWKPSICRYEGRESGLISRGRSESEVQAQSGKH
ncbi:MAG TPA: alpha-ketoglutarate-dependent dioxygenase AlkB, partial [Nitrospira sp.]|nr:alpha-ketoglutarate-dependent dioxygenase AlkB [Nitrospira sp.]